MSATSIPEKTTHVFVNTKNKKSFYSNKQDGTWEIFNKGLNTWEKVPSLDLALIPINIYLQNELSSKFNDIEDTTIDIINVTTKNNQTSISELKSSFVTPPIDADDYENIYNLFLKYNTGSYPLGFIPGENNYSVYFNHELKEWSYNISSTMEFLTIYTVDVSLVRRIVRELNSALHQNI